MEIKEEIHKWLVETIIGLNLCPFAKEPFDAGHISITVSQAQQLEDAYKDFISEISFMHSSSTIRTKLLAYPNINDSFEIFNDFCGSLEEILEENDLENIFQIVGFHPKFRFEGLESNDKANYVNRAPYPVIHILLAQDVALAANTIKTGENISQNNERTIKSLSSHELKKYFVFL